MIQEQERLFTTQQGSLNEETPESGPGAGAGALDVHHAVGQPQRRYSNSVGLQGVVQEQEHLISPKRLLEWTEVR